MHGGQQCDIVRGSRRRRDRQEGRGAKNAGREKQRKVNDDDEGAQEEGAEP